VERRLTAILLPAPALRQKRSLLVEHRSELGDLNRQIAFVDN